MTGNTILNIRCEKHLSDIGANIIHNLSHNSCFLQNVETGAPGGNDADSGSDDTMADGVISDTLNAINECNELIFFIELMGTR